MTEQQVYQDTRGALQPLTFEQAIGTLLAGPRLCAAVDGAFCSTWLSWSSPQQTCSVAVSGVMGSAPGCLVPSPMGIKLRHNDTRSSVWYA